MKILSLTSKDWLRGISMSPDYEDDGRFQLGEGIDFYRNMGMLGSGFDKTIIDTAGSVVTDQIQYFAADAPRNVVYAMDDNTPGNLLKIASNDSISLTATTTFVNHGLYNYKDYLIYPTSTRMRKYGPLSSSPTKGQVVVGEVMTSMTIHPLMRGPDGRCYVGDDNELNSFDDPSMTSTSGWVTGDFVLDSDFDITCMENDGYYLVVGATRFFGAFRNNESKVYFWDTFTEGWNQEWTIPDSSISAMKQVGDWIYAFCTDGVWRFTSDNPPERVVSRGSGIRNIFPTGGNLNTRIPAVDVWKNTLLWGNRNIWSYGSADRKLPEIVSNPFKITTPTMGGTVADTVYAIHVANDDKIYVSSYDHKLYVFKTGNSSAIAQTALLDLGRSFKITDIKITSKELASGDSLTVEVNNEAGDNILTGTYSFVKDGAVTWKVINTKGNSTNMVDQVEIKLTFTGNIQLKRIELFGLPLPLHHGR